MREEKTASKKSKNFSDSQFRSEVKFVKESLRKEILINKILGTSKIVQDMHKKIAKISLYDVNILISGETGTGKEIAARAIHYLSLRSAQPFIPINCGAIPEHLFENELFGHVKGAFTDASVKQNGLVKEAEGGTLFLDEIGVISPFIQVKLLRLLQDNEYKPLGDSIPRTVDLRIIAATNMDLEALIKEGKFREDLYYRLNIVSINIPPLRERKEDIPVLVEYFIKKYTKEYHKIINMLSPNSLNKLINHYWPGNIRELENKVQQLIVTSADIDVDTGEIEIPAGRPGIDMESSISLKECKKNHIESFERNYLNNLLVKHKGQVVQAAREAGTSRTGLWNLLKKHQLSPKNFQAG